MATNVPKETVCVNNEETKIWSIYNCIFCNKLLDGRSKILNCLHVICINCVEKYTINSGVKCKCLVVSKEKPIDYNIVSPDITIQHICDTVTCNTVATKKCVMCNSLYCKSCAQTHLTDKEDHWPGVIKSYPMVKEIISCTCKKNYIEVYCTECSIMHCSMCHLENHKTHDFKLIETLGNEIKSNFERQKDDLEINDLWVKVCLEKLDDQTKTIELQKKMVEEKIDREFLKLLNETKGRKEKLLNLQIENVSNTSKQIAKNKLILINLKNENDYYANLIKSLLKHNKTYDTVNCLKICMDKISDFKNTSEYILKEGVGSNIESNLIFDNESVENCLSSIKNIGKVTSTSVESLPEKLNEKMTNNVTQASNTSQSTSRV